MNSIAQEARFRQRVVKYFYKHGATEASKRFKVCRQSVYNWAARYDGALKSPNRLRTAECGAYSLQERSGQAFTACKAEARQSKDRTAILTERTGCQEKEKSA